jgi:hypothetical protein
MSKQWDNENRTRYYGKRVGDTVEYSVFGQVFQCEVIAYTPNNNRIRVRFEDGDEGDLIAELCKVVAKVEDKS